MKRLRFILIVTGCLTLSACQTDQTPEAKKKPVEIKQEVIQTKQGSTIKIVPLYTEYLQYLQKAGDTQDQTKNQEVFDQTVTDAVKKIVKGDRLHTGILFEKNYLRSTNYPSELEVRTAELVKNDLRIKEVVKRQLLASSMKLPGGDKTIFIVPVDSDVTSFIEPMGGLTAVTFSEDVFVLYLDSKFDEKALAFATAHEYHHAVVYENSALHPSDIMDYVIMEGKADVFATQIVNDFKPVWQTEMDSRTKQNVLYQIKTNLATSTDLTEGNNDKNIPRWSSYTLGKDFMQDYLKRYPDQSIKDWTNAKTQDIVKEYRYKNSVQ